MIVALVVGAGFVVLLIAPTIHRNINEKSRNEAETMRVSRAESLRTSSHGATLHFDNAGKAALLRDRLLLNGVRAELIQEDGQTLLIYNRSDEATVTTLTGELGIE